MLSTLRITGLALLSVAGLHAAEPLIPASTLGLQLGPDTTVVTGPLDADGYPDYVAALNERLSAGVTRDENFWVLMWPAIGNAERTREDFLAQVEQRLNITISREPLIRDPYYGLEGNTPEFQRIDEQYTQALQRPWTRDEFPDIARTLDASKDLFVQVHAACQRPKAYAPLVALTDARPALIQCLLPHVQAMRSVARLLAARSMLRLGEGDVDGAWTDLLDLYRLGRHLERGSTLIESLVGYAIRSIALQPTGHWVARCELTAAELDAHWRQLEPLLPTPTLAHSLDGERFMYLDTVTFLMANRSRGSEALKLLEPVGIVASDEDASADSLRSARQMAFQLLFLGSDVNETLRYGNAMYDDLVAALEPRSHTERSARLRAIESRVKANRAATGDAASVARLYLFGSRQEIRQLPAKVLTSLLVPAIAQVETAQTRIESYRPLLRAAFLIQRQLAARGEFPLSLSDVGDADAADLSDPFASDSIRFAAQPGGIVLYSVGPNGVDNGGQRPDETPGADDLRLQLPIAP